MTRELISVCIPTYRRPDLLAEAVRSVAEQGYRPLEILVGDDSPSDESRDVLDALPLPADVALRYRRNAPRLGQNANVNDLFARANGASVMLLHDDDRLLPNALETLAAARAAASASLAFGRQEIISADGVLLPAETEAVNRRYFRTPDRAGAIERPLEAALLQQIPNNGVLVDAALARAVGYRSDDEVGAYGDLDFNLRLGLAPQTGRAVFVAAFCSQYRYSLEAVSNDARTREETHPRAGLLLYRFVEERIRDGAYARARAVLLERLSDKAFKGALLARDRAGALRIFFGPAYPPRRRCSPRGLYHLALLAAPGLGRALGRARAHRPQRER